MKCRDVQDLAQGGGLLATMLQEDESSSKWLRSGRSKVRSHYTESGWASPGRRKGREKIPKEATHFFSNLVFTCAYVGACVPQCMCGGQVKPSEPALTLTLFKTKLSLTLFSVRQPSWPTSMAQSEVLLSPSPISLKECWDYRYTAPHLALCEF